MFKLLLLSILFGQMSYANEGKKHNFNFDKNPESIKIYPGVKTFDGQEDDIFIDGLGREVHLRGWNVSGAVKLGSSGFLPFRNLSDAEKTFKDIRVKSGANNVRFLLSWEGVHPQIDTIDYSYLDRLVAQVKEAIKNKIYVYLDWHMDIFSRYFFDENHRDSGNGAPQWVTPLEIYPESICHFCVHWGMNIFLNERVKKGYLNFWENRPFPTSKGTRYLQTEFLWQLEKTLVYVKSKLSEEEMNYIIGVDPMNEPIDGDRGGLTPYEFDNKLLWPFYERVKKVMNKAGWEDKFAMGEPVVTWIFNSPFFKVTGGSHLDYSPGKGFVFNSHFYDTNRMGLNFKRVYSGTHLKYFDLIRRESRHFKAPPFLSEFGMVLNKVGEKDNSRMLNSIFQSTELSYNGMEEGSNYPSFYGPLISSSQWHWDIYSFNHHEPKNGNPNIIVTKGDGINNENFSVVKDFGKSYAVDKYIVERMYPRRAQGPIMSFAYNAIPKDSLKRDLKWHALRPNENGTMFFKDNRFGMLIWRGKSSLAPTEIFIPRFFDLNNTLIMTDSSIIEKASTVFQEKMDSTNNDIVVVNDILFQGNSGKRLFIWDESEGLHFALIVEKNNYDLNKLKKIQAELIKRINLGKSPIYLNEKRIRVDTPKFMIPEWVSPHLPSGATY